MSTKPELAKFDRTMTQEFTPVERWRFKIGRKVIDVMVMRVIGRAYERGLISTAVMHEIAFIWKCVCFPERPLEMHESTWGGEKLPVVKRWYRRGERELILPAVLAFVGKTQEEYFTSVFAGLETEEQRWFVNSEHWTHWHPLDSAPLADITPEPMRKVAEEMADTARRVIDEEKRFGGRIR